MSSARQDNEAVLSELEYPVYAYRFGGKTTEGAPQGFVDVSENELHREAGRS